MPITKKKKNKRKSIKTKFNQQSVNINKIFRHSPIDKTFEIYFKILNNSN